MTCLRCSHGTAKRFGYYGRRRIQRYRCRSCSATFTLPREKILGSHTLDVGKAIQIVKMLMEGMGVRSVSRLTGVHKATILSLLVTVGRKCQDLLDSKIRGLRPWHVELDETWTFVHTKEKHLRSDDPAEWGDQYVWVALDSTTRLIICHRVGKRDTSNALTFVRDLSERTIGRFQITTDALRAYIPAVYRHFGLDVDMAQLVKTYGRPDSEGPHWYGPPVVLRATPTPVIGHPRLDIASTSYVERSNLSFRTSLRRFTRLCLGFSKKLENLKATVSLYCAWYNLCRCHSTLGMTPAMASHIADHAWSVEELISTGV